MWIYTCSGRNTRHTGSLFRSTDFHTNKRLIASFCIRNKGRKFVISLHINKSISSRAARALTQLLEYIKWIFCLSSFSAFSSTPSISFFFSSWTLLYFCVLPVCNLGMYCYQFLKYSRNNFSFFFFTLIL